MQLSSCPKDSRAVFRYYTYVCRFGGVSSTMSHLRDFGTMIFFIAAAPIKSLYHEQAIICIVCYRFPLTPQVYVDICCYVSPFRYGSILIEAPNYYVFIRECMLRIPTNITD